MSFIYTGNREATDDVRNKYLPLPRLSDVLYWHPLHFLADRKLLRNFSRHDLSDP